MAALTFNQTKHGVYTTASSLVYYMPPAVKGPRPSGTLTLKEVWYDYNGYFIFVDPAHSTSILAALEVETVPDFLHPFQDKRHLLWLSSGTGGVEVIGKVTFKVNQWNNFATVTESSEIGIGNYTMPIDSGMMIYPTKDGTRLEPSDFDQATHFSLLHPESKQESDYTQHIHVGEDTDALGTISGLGIISDFSNDKASGWEVGLRYFMNDGEEVVSQFYQVFDNPAENYYAFQMQWDLFNPTLDTNTFLQFTGQQFNLSETDGVYQLNDVTPTQVMNSFFRTREGQVITLYPNPSAGEVPKLLFQEKSSSSSSGTEYYLVPSGEFILGIEGVGTPGSVSTTPYQLLCGLTGTEYITFCPGDIMNFTAGQPAMAPTFPASVQNSNEVTSGLLTSSCQTAWVEILPTTVTTPSLPESPRYNSQPESSPLYQQEYAAGTPNATDQPEVFAYQGHYENPLLNLGSSSSVSNGTYSGLEYSQNPFPLVPYGALVKQNTIPFLAAANGPQPANFEAEILSPVRKTQLSLSSDPSPGSDPVVTINPQGLLVTVDKDTADWSQVLLATNQVKKADKSAPGGYKEVTYNLCFHNLTRTLTNALQSSQQFIVISTSSEVGTPEPQGTAGGSTAWFDAEMSIEGWPFMFNMPATKQTSGYGNVMIIKFCNGKLLDMVGSPQNWTEGEKLNGVTQTSDLGGLSNWMSDYITKGIASYENGDEDFAQFAQIATDPDWQGVIGLNVDIDFKDFPSQLQGLLAGIDESKFTAHHFGIQVNQPKLTTDEVLELGIQSNMFGLINYTSPPLPAHIDPSSPFDFTVLLLKVVFQQSKITNFKGRIQLLVNELFGSTVGATTVQGLPISSNSLFFDSGFEVHDGIPVYTFTDLQDTRFAMQNTVLDYVEISKATFNTILPSTKADPQPIIKSRFTIWGYMGFAPSGDAVAHPNSTPDLFSYGELPGAKAPKTGLSFSNMLVNMDFANTTPPGKPVFTTETAHLEFDKALSSIRPKSMVDQLAMSIGSLVSGSGSADISKLGFIPMEMDIPGANWQSPEKDWFGITFDMNLGGLGAMGAKVTFTAKLLLAWGVDSSPGIYPAAVGIALPGVNGKGQLFDLEGILKVTMDGIKLIGAINTSTNSIGYIIQISDIALKFLGIKLPPGASTEFLIFGNPSAANTDHKLGWYGAFTDKS